MPETAMPKAIRDDDQAKPSCAQKAPNTAMAGDKQATGRQTAPSSVVRDRKGPGKHPWIPEIMHDGDADARQDG